MSRVVHCVVLKREAEGLERVPYPGELGRRIYENVSREGWARWLQQQTMLINEYRLTPIEPKARKFLETEMEKFFFGPGSPAPEGYQPPKSGQTLEGRSTLGKGKRLLPLELEQYLHRHLPLSQAMAVRVVSISEDAIVLRAPLLPNINHNESVFGGSASALAILAAWSLPHVRLAAAGVANRLVIQRNAMEYLRPMTGEFTARSAIAEPEAWRRFTRTLARKRVARIAVSAELEFAGQVSGRFSGEFVAFASAVPQR